MISGEERKLEIVQRVALAELLERFCPLSRKKRHAAACSGASWEVEFRADPWLTFRDVQMVRLLYS